MEFSDSDEDPLKFIESSDEWEPENGNSIEISEEAVNDQEVNKKRTRKRKTNESKRQQQKRRRNSGLQYETKKGKLVKGKTFKNVDCECRFKCFQKITEDQRRHIFESFWKMNSFSNQNIFLCGLIKQHKPNVSRPRDSSRKPKLSTNEYHFTVNAVSTKVCKKYFLQTLSISDGRVTRALKKLFMDMQPGSDNRGCHTPKNKTTNDRMDVVRNHIASFPSYQSHYSRSQNPNRKYLSSNLNVRLMYELYKQQCTAKDIIPVTESVYRRTFNNEFNLHFHSPLKDTCTRCDEFQIKIKAITENEQENKELQIQHELHLKKAEAARNSMKMDSARKDDSLYCFTFDLQKALPFPILTTSVAYYKRNLYCYNLGCHELETDLGFMYVWDETVASRGSQEVSACVKKHITTRAVRAKHVIMYSDACTGQNRNIKFTLNMMQFIQSDDHSIETIDHKFMVSGHSYLPNDSDFGSIELYAKNKLMYTPDDWFDAILKCRKKKSFHVTKMGQGDFKSVTALEKCITKRKKNTSNFPVNWLNIQWIRVSRDQPYSIQYKETLNDYVPFHTLDVRPRQSGRPSSLKKVILEPLYKEPRKVQQKKKQDMMDLLPYIPPIYHNFFNSLPVDQNENVGEDSGPLEHVENMFED